MTTLRLLVVEDEPKLRSALERGLQEQAYEVVVAADGEQAWKLATQQIFDCVVLDRQIPGRDGLQLLRDLRAGGIRVPVLMLTARGALEDRVEGLDCGADDYLAKPFAWSELLARIRACLRRASPKGGAVLVAGSFRLDVAAHKLITAERELELTERESELLEYFIRRPGRTISREQLARDVWQEPEVGLTNIVDVYVAKLRKRLERIGEANRIKTIRGVGYRFGDS